MSRAMWQTARSWGLVAALAGTAACESDSKVAPGSGDEPAGDYRVSVKNDVQWKRYATFESDLASALELDPASLCQEFGEASCIREAHLVPLGGNDPFDTGILQPAAEPLATTPAVVDRVLLSACGQRVALDRAAPVGQAVVFKGLDLNGPAPVASESAVSTTVVELYRRLLARDPSPREVDAVAELSAQPSGARVAAADFATLACFAVGGSTEFLFY